jgi:ligand-binding sensor domain-containing protein
VEFESKITNTLLDNDKVYCFQKLRGDYLAIGTVGSGVLILDQNYEPAQVFSIKNGLQSNTILAMGSDSAGNLWVATEVGIDYIEIASSFNKVNINYNLEGTVYSTVIVDDILYVATNVGLFYSPWIEKENPLKPTLNFKKVNELIGQAWKLYTVNNVVYVCHQSGFYYLKDNQPIQIGTH